MIYDLIIIGGGISGLYLHYKITRLYPQWNILLLEKENRFGGRVDTYTDKYMQVEAGAGRFNDSHVLLLELIRELGLARKMEKISSSAVFFPADGSGIEKNSVFDAPLNEHGFGSFVDPLFLGLLDIRLGKTLPNAGLISRIILSATFESRETLQKQTFGEYALKIVGQKNLEFIKESFGYYSELVIMNAYDAIQLMWNLGPLNQFYGLSGGLSQIIEKMIEKIEKNKNNRLLLNRPVFDIQFEQSICYVVCKGRKTAYSGKRCVLATTKNVLEKLPLFRPLRPLLKKINCGTLCRIYSKFNVEKGEHLWFRDLPKLTTNNHLRMVIPIDYKNGIIMISYTDNFYADFWQTLFEKKGEPGVNKELLRLMKMVIGKDIPLPLKTRVFYWECGVGYWGKGADSHVISEKMVRPFEERELYVCGENVSEKHQQWMEGGLDTAKKVIDSLCEHII